MSLIFNIAIGCGAGLLAAFCGILYSDNKQAKRYVCWIREDFRDDNEIVVWCQPPNNKLAGKFITMKRDSFLMFAFDTDDETEKKANEQADLSMLMFKLRLSPKATLLYPLKIDLMKNQKLKI